MRIEDGMLVLETQECWSCDGSGEQDERVRIACPTCKGTGKGVRGGRNGCKNCHGLRYEWASTGGTEDCYQCDGTGQKQEDIYDHVTPEFWQGLDFEVRRSNRGQSFYEQYIGLGCWSCMDYGEHKSMTDEQLIEKVRNSTHAPQACKLVNGKDDLRISGRVAIVTASTGYSVMGVAAE